MMISRHPVKESSLYRSCAYFDLFSAILQWIFIGIMIGFSISQDETAFDNAMLFGFLALVPWFFSTLITAIFVWNYFGKNKPLLRKLAIIGIFFQIIIFMFYFIIVERDIRGKKKTRITKKHDENFQRYNDGTTFANFKGGSGNNISVNHDSNANNYEENLGLDDFNN